MKTMKNYSPRGMLFRLHNRRGNWLFWERITGKTYPYLDGRTEEIWLEGEVRLHTKQWAYKLL